MSDVDVHSDDDGIDVKSIPRQAELPYDQSELLKPADNQSSLETNVLNHLQHTDLSFNSKEIKLPQKYPSISIFDIDLKNYRVSFAPTYTNRNNGCLFKYQKNSICPSSS